MPIYEYRCNNCKRKVTLLILNRSIPPTCNHCGGKDLTRLLSRFAAPKSEEARLESLADPARWGDFDENDPSSMARFMKRMGREFGEELGDEFNEEIESAVEEAYRGESDSDESVSAET